LLIATDLRQAAEMLGTIFGTSGAATGLFFPNETALMQERYGNEHLTDRIYNK